MTTFCLLPPDRVPTGRFAIGWADVKGANKFVGRISYGPAFKHATVAEHRPSVSVRDQIFGDSQVREQAKDLTIFGDKADASLDHLRRRATGKIVSTKFHGSRRNRTKPDQSLAELGLAIAIDASDADNFACVNIEGEVAHCVLAAFVAHIKVTHREYNRAFL